MVAKRWMGAILVCVLSSGALALAGQKPATLPPVPLVVDFDDSPGMRITSDGQGSYIDGVDGVTANIDQYGNVIINFQATRSPLRKVSYDYSERLGATAAPPVDANNITAPPNSYFSTIHPTNGLKLQAMQVGTSQCTEGAFTFTLDDAGRTQYRHSFQRNLSPFDVSMTSYLFVTRTSPTRWELGSNGACSGVADTVKLIETPTKGKFSYTDDGLYRMPVHLTLTAK